MVYVFASRSLTFSLLHSLSIARPTPSSLTPTVTTCTVCPPLSTWLPLLTSPRRNACECTHTHMHAITHFFTALIFKKLGYFSVFLDGRVRLSTTWSVSMTRRNKDPNPIVCIWITLSASLCLHTTGERHTHAYTETSMLLRYASHRHLCHLGSLFTYSPKAFLSNIQWRKLRVCCRTRRKPWCWTWETVRSLTTNRTLTGTGSSSQLSSRSVIAIL